MKLLCVPCDEPMKVVESKFPDEVESMTVIFHCPHCGQATAMLTNAGETQLVRSLGVRIGASEAPATSLGHLRTNLVEIRADTIQTGGQGDEPTWTPEALERLNAAPSFVQSMIRQVYTDYARQHGLREVTLEVMDAARQALGLG